LATCIQPDPGIGTFFATASVLTDVPATVHFALATYGSGALFAGSLSPTADWTQGAITCVRGGNNIPTPTNTNRFVVDGLADTFLDILTGLTWQRTASANVLSTDAATYCDNVAQGGTGWRLPTALEAATLIDFDGSNMEFAGDQLQGFGVGDLSDGTHLLWTSNLDGNGARIVFGDDVLKPDDMTNVYGGNQILCVKSP
jgi:hypothetical protein